MTPTGQKSATLPVADYKPFVLTQAQIKSIVSGDRVQVAKPANLKHYPELDNEQARQAIATGTKNPYGGRGTFYWVQENWQAYTLADTGLIDGKPTRSGRRIPVSYNVLPDNLFEYYEPGMKHWQPVYQAIDDLLDAQDCWLSPQAMPKSFTRITLEQISLKFCRLQEVTPEDLLKEGINWYLENMPKMSLTRNKYDYSKLTPLELYKILWDTKHAEREEFLWDKNPFVWRIEFRLYSVVRREKLDYGTLFNLSGAGAGAFQSQNQIQAQVQEIQTDNKPDLAVEATLLALRQSNQFIANFVPETVVIERPERPKTPRKGRKATGVVQTVPKEKEPRKSKPEPKSVIESEVVTGGSGEITDTKNQNQKRNIEAYRRLLERIRESKEQNKVR
jgi:hypothetical protein